MERPLVEVNGRAYAGPLGVCRGVLSCVRVGRGSRIRHGVRRFGHSYMSGSIRRPDAGRLLLRQPIPPSSPTATAPCAAECGPPKPTAFNQGYFDRWRQSRSLNYRLLIRSVSPARCSPARQGSKLGGTRPANTSSGMSVRQKSVDIPGRKKVQSAGSMLLTLTQSRILINSEAVTLRKQFRMRRL